MAAGTSIAVGQTAKIVARLESSGEAVSSAISMTETTGHGTLAWNSRMTGDVTVTEEEVDVVNDIANQSQCVLAVTPSSVTGIYAIDVNGEATGSNLVKPLSEYGRTIDLNTQLATGTKLLATYVKGGSVENTILGVSEGTAKVVVSADVGLEKGLSQTVDVAVTATPGDPGPPPPGPPPPPPPPPAAEDFSVSGPGVLQWFRSGWWCPPSGWGWCPSNPNRVEVWFLALNQWSVISSNSKVSVTVTAREISSSVFCKLSSYPSVTPTFGIGKNPGSVTITLDYSWYNSSTAERGTGTISKNVIINPG